MKNLANCKPSEFLAQTVKIRKYVADWLSVTKISEIRKNVPKFTEGMTKEEKSKALTEAAKKNLGKMFDSIFEENAQKTLGLMALMCFVEPEEVDNHPMSYYFQSVSELIESPEVVNFFISLVRLANRNISNAAKA